MFFPIRTDRPQSHFPLVNTALVAANVLVFLWIHEGSLKDSLTLDPVSPELWYGFPYQFLTYQFLHADFWHLLGNMVFLYVFGNSVEDRLGKVGYLAFYLGAGVLAGLTHSLSDVHRVLGASGAVCAVTGAYMALFPRSYVTIIYFFFFIGTFELPSLWLIGFQMAQNLVMQLSGGGGVAYAAHLGGYAYGFAVGMGLLLFRLLPREPFDLLALIERYRRRQKFRRVAADGPSPWSYSTPGPPPPAADTRSPAISERDRQIMERRARITSLLDDHNLDEAARLYTLLLSDAPDQVMTQQQQLDLANHLMGQSRHDAAAKAYELFLNTYPRYHQREQVELILGLIYARYLNLPSRAGELLRKALPRLQDPQQRDLAEQALGIVGS